MRNSNSNKKQIHFITAILILINLLFSCTNLLDEDKNNDTANLNIEKSAVYINLSVKNDDKGKSAMPSIPAGTTYIFTVDDNPLNPQPTPTAGFYFFELEEGVHTIIVECKSEGKTILQGQRVITVISGKPYSETIEMKFVEDENQKGNISLGYDISALSVDLNAKYVEVEDNTWQNMNVEDNKISATNLKPGYYTVKIILTVSEVEVYSAYFTIPVFSNLTTDTWTDYEVTPFISDNKFKVTGDQYSNLINTTVYVAEYGSLISTLSADGDDANGDGSFLKPYEKLSKAIYIANVLGASGQTITVYVAGTVHESMAGSSIGSTVKIKGYNGTGIITLPEAGGGGASAGIGNDLIKIGNGGFLTLEDIEIKGYHSVGGSFYVIKDERTDNSSHMGINGYVKVDGNSENINTDTDGNVTKTYNNIYLKNKIKVFGNLLEGSKISVTTDTAGMTGAYQIFTDGFKLTTNWYDSTAALTNDKASVFFASDLGYTVGTVEETNAEGEAALIFVKNDNNQGINQKDLFTDKLKVVLEDADTSLLNLASLFIPGINVEKRIKIFKWNDDNLRYEDLVGWSIDGAELYYGNTKIEDGNDTISFTPQNDNYRLVVYFTYDDKKYSETVNLKPINPKNLYESKETIKGVRGNHIKIALNNADDIWYMGSYLNSNAGKDCEFLTIYLANSIDWNSRTDTTKTFVPLALNKSVFNGKGYSVYGLDMPKITETVYGGNYNAAFIGRSVYSIIRDLTVYGETAGAGIVYYMESSFVGNCVNYTNTKSSNTTSENGGICSIIGNGGAFRSMFQYCRNYGNIGTENTSYCAGILAIDKNTRYQTIYGMISACSNYGDITGRKIAGIAVSNTAKTSCYDCFNYGSLNIIDEGSGIIEYEFDMGNTFNIKSCYSLGTINIPVGKTGYVVFNKDDSNSVENVYYLEGIAGSFHTSSTGVTKEKIYTKDTTPVSYHIAAGHITYYTMNDLLSTEICIHDIAGYVKDEGTGYPYIAEYSNTSYGKDYIKYPDPSIF